ncbi:hypothetical protein, partial [Caballeronia sp. INML3]|uniref:hypothetical protein n=1 Tax=Caballeronia sp. INML3 TaxID=2921752 RepID=UPI0020322B43
STTVSVRKEWFGGSHIDYEPAYATAVSVKRCARDATAEQIPSRSFMFYRREPLLDKWSIASGTVRSSDASYPEPEP